jgi:hypothetical protein
VARAGFGHKAHARAGAGSAGPGDCAFHDVFPCVSSLLIAGILSGFGGGELYKFLHFETLNLLQRNKNTRTIANRRAFLHAPVVSSTL